MSKRDDEQLAYAQAIDELDRMHAAGTIGDSEHKLKREKLEAEAAKAKGKLGMGCGLLAAVVPVLLIGGCFAFINSGDDGDSSASNDRAIAIQMCRDSVRRQLKAPSGAKFSGETVVSQSGNVYTIRGAVDSENSFGAKIRTPYSCQAGVENGTRLNAVATLEE